MILPNGTSDPAPQLLAGRSILVSGGAGAIGVVLAERLTALGATVVVTDISAPAEPCRSSGQVVGDITDEREVTRILDECVATLGRMPDVVCCHAGVAAAAPIADFDVAEFDRIMEVNVRGSFLLAREAVRRWTSATLPGNLIFTSSWVEGVPWPEITPYAASKAAVRAMMRGFARELAPMGIRANAISPGIVATGMAMRQWEDDPSYRARAERAVPLGSLQRPESVADAVAFLASDLSSYMTGATLLVDGGCSLYPMD